MKCFTITLPEDPERENRARQHFKERGVVTEWFDGIHAQTAGLSTEHTYEIDNPGTGFRIGYKPTGIWISHIMIWKALNLLPDQHFMVLEVDAKFPVDWPARTERALKDVPADFDGLFIGSCCCQGRPTTHIKGEVFEVKWPACTHAVIWAKKAFPVLTSLRKIHAPIDLEFSLGLAGKLKLYTVLPRICDQFDTEIWP